MTAWGAGRDGCEISARIAHAMAGQRHRGAGRSRSPLACSKSCCTASAGHQGDRCVEARGVLRRSADRLIAGATAR